MGFLSLFFSCKTAVSFVAPTQYQCSLLFLCRCITLSFSNCTLFLKNCFSNLSRQLWILTSTNILVIPAGLALLANFVRILFISSSRRKHWVIWESEETLWKQCLIILSLISKTNTGFTHNSDILLEHNVCHNKSFVLADLLVSWNNSGVFSDKWKRKRAKMSCIPFVNEVTSMLGLPDTVHSHLKMYFCIDCVRCCVNAPGDHCILWELRRWMLTDVTESLLQRLTPMSRFSQLSQPRFSF